MEKEKKTSSSTVFKVGAISLAFLILGYQTALFVHRAAALRIADRRDHPDTVYIIQEISVPMDTPQPAETTLRQVRRDAPHAEPVREIRDRSRRVETFRFNPNTADAEELQRLGFSQKQAAAIINYRAKGGRFARKADFAKSFVVADSVYRRLEPFIDIPRVDINKADSAALDALPGIGPYFAARILEYRTQLGGFRSTEQLMDIKYFDKEKYDALSDLIFCGDDDPE